MRWAQDNYKQMLHGITFEVAGAPIVVHAPHPLRWYEEKNTTKVFPCMAAAFWPSPRTP